MNRMLCILMAVCALSMSSLAQGYQQVAAFACPQATQGVAVDDNYFYAIGNQVIAKYSKDGRFVQEWREENRELITHFDGGIVIDGLLYCSHSNYPDVPMASSVEVFDTKDLSHVKTISLGIDVGSCTWVLKGDGCWYLGFAHYDISGGHYGGEMMKDASWSQIVQYDQQWHKVQAWILPKALLDELRPNSISGALYIDGKFYCAGHDATKLFILEFPPYGMRMLYTGSIDMPMHGQGIAMDSEGFLWGIDRKTRTVIKSKLR